MEELDRSRDRLLWALDGLTQDQWRHRPADDRWSIAECAERIRAGEVSIPKLLASPITVERPPEGWWTSLE